MIEWGGMIFIFDIQHLEATLAQVSKITIMSPTVPSPAQWQPRGELSMRSIRL